MAEYQTAPATNSTANPNYGSQSSFIPGAAPQTATPSANASGSAQATGPATNGGPNVGAGLSLPPAISPPAASGLPPIAGPATVNPAATPAPGPVAIPRHDNIDQFLSQMKSYREDNFAYWQHRSGYEYRADSERRIIDKHIRDIETVLAGEDSSPAATGRFQMAVKGLLHSVYEFEHLLNNPKHGEGQTQQVRTAQALYEDNVVAELSTEAHGVMEARARVRAAEVQTRAALDAQQRYETLRATLPKGILEAYGEQISVPIDGAQKVGWNVRIGDLKTYVTTNRDGNFVFALVPPAGGELKWQTIPSANAPIPPNESYELHAFRQLLNILRDAPTASRDQLDMLERGEAIREQRAAQNSRWGHSKLAADTMLELMTPTATGEETYQVKWGTTDLLLRRSPNANGRIEWALPDQTAWTPTNKLPFPLDTKNPEQRAVNARIGLLELASHRDENGVTGGYERLAVTAAKTIKGTADAHVRAEQTKQALSMFNESGDILLRDVVGATRQPDNSYLMKYGGYDLQFRRNDQGLWEWRQTSPDTKQAWTSPEVRYSAGNYPTVPPTFACFNRALFFLDCINKSQPEFQAIMNEVGAGR